MRRREFIAALSLKTLNICVFLRLIPLVLVRHLKSGLSSTSAQNPLHCSGLFSMRRLEAYRRALA
jgi:hypothetical protein